MGRYLNSHNWLDQRTRRRVHHSRRQVFLDGSPDVSTGSEPSTGVNPPAGSAEGELDTGENPDSPAIPNTTDRPEPNLPSSESDAEVERIDIERVTVADENSYSSAYGPDKTIDNNIASSNYWSTKAGSIIEVVLNFSLEEENTVSEIHFISTRSGSSYTQPQSLELLFFNASDEEVAKQEIELAPPNSEWERHSFEAVPNVSRVQIELLDPLNDTASYMTLNEVQFYGYPSN